MAYWPDTGTGVDTQPARKPVQSAIRKYFTEGGLGQAPTVPGGDWFNQMTNEVLNVLEAAGIEPSKEEDDQLLKAIRFVSGVFSSREALRRSYRDVGLKLADGSFQLGSVLYSKNDVILDSNSGKAYIFNGAYPPSGYVVAAGTDPSSPGFVDVSELTLSSKVMRFSPSGSFSFGGAALSGVTCLFNDSDGFFYTPRDGSLTVGPNSSPDLSWVCVGNATMKKNSHSLFCFGAKDDNGVTDNRVFIQNALDYMQVFSSTLMANSSRDEKFFGVSSFSTLPFAAPYCLVITKPRTVDIYGARNRNSSIRYTGSAPGEALLAFQAGTEDWGVGIKSLGLSAGNKLDYAICGDDVWYAQANFEGGCYEDAVLDGIRFSCYMSSFKRVFANNCGRDGFSFVGPASEGGDSHGTTTSLSLDNCWARRPSRYGFSVANELWYSEWSSTGCDGYSGLRVPFAYRFYNVKGVTLNGIGAEYCERLLYAGSFRGLTISGVQLSEMGQEEGMSPSCIELVSGFDATLSGFSPVDAFNSKYDKILHVSGATGNEFVVIQDASIRSDKVLATKASPSGFYRYPDIIYFAVSASQDRGFARTADILHLSADVAFNQASAYRQDTVLSREFCVRTASPTVVQFFEQSSGGDFDAVVDITSISGADSDYTQLYVYKRGTSTSFDRPLGSPVSGWTFSVVGSSAKITVADSVPRCFFVKIRFYSADSVVLFNS